MAPDQLELFGTATDRRGTTSATDTQVVSNPTATAASTDTAYNGGAGQDRRPLAYAARVNLSEHVRSVQAGGGAVDSGLIVKPGVSELVDHFTGFTFGAACTEVEIDVLTGETTIRPSERVGEWMRQGERLRALGRLARFEDAPAPVRPALVRWAKGSVGRSEQPDAGTQRRKATRPRPVHQVTIGF